MKNIKGKSAKLNVNLLYKRNMFFFETKHLYRDFHSFFYFIIFELDLQANKLEFGHAKQNVILKTFSNYLEILIDIVAEP